MVVLMAASKADKMDGYLVVLKVVLKVGYLAYLKAGLMDALKAVPMAMSKAEHLVAQ